MNRANHRGTVKHGISHTLKTEIDCGVIEIIDEIEVLGNYSPSGHNAARIIDKNGLSPTVMENHGTVSAIVEDEWLSQKGVNYVLDPKRGMCTDVNAEISQTLTAKGQNNWTGSFISPDIEEIEKPTEIGSKEPTKITLKNGEQITSEEKEKLNGIRIRKLTPRECGRLMGFDDESITKMLSVTSNSQAYKQFGNSIVVDVLYYIFKEMM